MVLGKGWLFHLRLEMGPIEEGRKYPGLHLRSFYISVSIRGSSDFACAHSLLKNVYFVCFSSLRPSQQFSVMRGRGFQNLVNQIKCREHSGSVVECLIRDREVKLPSGQILIIKEATSNTAPIITYPSTFPVKDKNIYLII